MLDYLSSDDCVKADYLVRIRLTSVSRRDVQGETLRSTIDAGYYTELAKRIPDMTPEEYEVELMIATGTIIDTGENFDTLVFISISPNFIRSESLLVLCDVILEAT